MMTWKVLELSTSNEKVLEDYPIDVIDSIR
jgi:hypothetical protein